MTTTHNSERAEQLTMLRESALSFVTKESPLNRARALRQQMPGYDRRFWAALAEQGWTISASRLIWKAKNPVVPESDAARAEVEAFLEALDEDDDVQSLYVALG